MIEYAKNHPMNNHRDFGFSSIQEALEEILENVSPTDVFNFLLQMEREKGYEEASSDVQKQNYMNTPDF
jgi:hypothetical protein